jgi:DNA replication licensing factor MCM6
MHRQNIEAITAEFSQEEMQTYIKFARHIKPQFTAESAECLKQEWKRLRKFDMGSTKNAYKVTVRQLESLVRLSEAKARIHCDTIIQPSYVKEVCRLLSTSNIHIVKGDVYFDEPA